MFMNCSKKYNAHCTSTLMKKKINIFLIYKEIQMGSGAKSNKRKGFLIYEERGKYLTIYEEAVSHIAPDPVSIH